MNFHQLKQYLLNNLLFGEQRAVRKSFGRLAATPLVMPDQSRVWGIDISHWNIPPVDLQRMIDLYSLDFVIIKGCDGTLKARYFDQHRATAKAAGIPWGIYDWLYPNSRVSVDAQVNAWSAQASEDPPPMGVFIDAESTTYLGQPANPTAADLRMAHDKWKAKTRTRATTYTSPGYAGTYLKGFDWTREELWIAHYGVNNPQLPAGATTYNIHQFTASLDGEQLDPNGNKELDGNYYNGSHAQFHERYGGEVPPDNGGTMFYGRNTTNLTNIRSGPATTYPDIGDLRLNDLIEASEKKKDSSGVDWWHLTKINRAGLNVPLPSVTDSWCWGTNIQELPPPDPEPTISPVLSTLQDIDFTAKTVTYTRRRKNGAVEVIQDPIE